MAADPQKYRLYEAERVFDGATGVRHFRSLKEMQDFADKVVASDWWAERSKVTKVNVFLGRKDASKAKSYSAGSSWRGKVQSVPFVTMPPTWAATDVVLIHELAHACVGNCHGHGPKYARTYLDMIEKFSGASNARELRKAFDEQKVEYGNGQAKTTAEVKAEAAKAKPMLSPSDETFLRLIGM